MIRNRIKGHRRVRAGDLVPHEWNFREHPVHQQAALVVLYEEVGFARSLLAYELPDGRLKLIDGHLRRDLDPDMEVEVEILDVSDEEARKLLLSLDPLAALATTDTILHDRLHDLTTTESPELEALWQQTANAGVVPAQVSADHATKREEEYLVLIKCEDEPQQVLLLERFGREGLDCRALLG